MTKLEIARFTCRFWWIPFGLACCALIPGTFVVNLLFSPHIALGWFALLISFPVVLYYYVAVTVRSPQESERRYALLSVFSMALYFVMVLLCSWIITEIISRRFY